MGTSFEGVEYIYFRRIKSSTSCCMLPKLTNLGNFEFSQMNKSEVFAEVNFLLKLTALLDSKVGYT